MPKKILTIGAGQAAIAFAAKLRELDSECEITLIGEEKSLPYQRPPLSKKYMTGEMETERLLLRPAVWFDENRIICRTKTIVTAIDLKTKEITAGGKAIAFDKLLIATGSTPRTLPASIGGDLAGVFTLRDLQDADTIGKAMEQAKNAIIIGGGYIGLEAASVFSQRGMNVTVIEMANRILKRVAAPETANILRAIHQSRGVAILEDTALKELSGDNGRVAKAVLSDGKELPADIVIVGIGVTPDDRLARNAGLVCGNGIEVDELTRTSHPDIFAAGDVASFEFNGKRIRLESVGNAIEQAEHAAKVITGHNEPYSPIPWFWSDQHDVKLQIAGLNMGYDATVVRPGARDGAQSVWYFSQGKFIAVDAINDPPAYMVGKKLLETGRQVTIDEIADETFDLRGAMKR